MGTPHGLRSLQRYGRQGAAPVAAMTTATDPVRRHDPGLLEAAQPGVRATGRRLAAEIEHLDDLVREMWPLHS
jgi:hypothetical protein